MRCTCKACLLGITSAGCRELGSVDASGTKLSLASWLPPQLSSTSWFLGFANNPNRSRLFHNKIPTAFKRCQPMLK